MLQWLIGILGAIFGAYFRELLKTPTKKKKEFKDVASDKKQPSNPDDIFKPSDW